jgi:hypothetical protein
MSAGLRTAEVLAAVAVARLLVGPQQLGGPVAAVSTAGQSMALTYQPHHLVVVKRGASCDIGDIGDIGDIVDYRDHSLNTLAPQRIIDRRD